MIDRRPRLIARCTNAADVIAAVNYGREAGITLAVRGGGHNAGGLGVADDALVIDLSRMRGVHVDPERRIVRAEGGAQLGDIDHATHPFGLAVPGGIVSTTGVGGLTLGGGHGYLTRAYGLTIDNLLSADAVTADGSYVTASEDHAEDLFWALRGGGGNFGVVTSFTFRLQPASIHVAGPTLWHLDQAAEAMQMYRRVLSEAPDELTAFFVFLVVPPGPPFPEELHMKNMCGVVWCHLGTPEEAEKALAAARALGPPAFEHVGPMPHPILQSMFDGITGPGMQNYWRADFFNDFSDEAIAAHVEHGAKVPTFFSGTFIFPIDGAASRVDPHATAWSYRDARFAENLTGADPDAARADDVTTWVVETWEAVHPYSAGGAYLNFHGDEGQERVQASYRDNYPRLAEIKKRYDPTNLFRV